MQFIVFHIGPLEAGFQKRFDMFISHLGVRNTVVRPNNKISLLKELMLSLRQENKSFVIFNSLFAFTLIVIWFYNPNRNMYYMVRGDEITWALSSRRRVRALVAFVFQSMLARMHVKFVFVSWDLQARFVDRYPYLKTHCVLPNTLGYRVPDMQRFDKNLAIVGDFGSVKNIEWIIDNLYNGKFNVDLYGNRTMPDEWKRPWLMSHGYVDNLVDHFRNNSILIVASLSEGFPNIILDALQAGCGVVLHRDFPFKYFPISDAWRFDLNSPKNEGDLSELERLLQKLISEHCDFKKDNPELIKLAETPWEYYVNEVFG